MKKLSALLLCLLLAFSPMVSSLAGEIPLAAKPLDLTDFEHYPAYAFNEESGRWSLHAYQADALLDRFWNYVSANAARTVVFHLAVEGDARTGVWTPVLRFYYGNGSRLNARAVAILADGCRYELAASSVMTAHGRSRAECITAPLDQQGMQLVDTLLAAEEITVRLIGDDIETFVISSGMSAERRRMEAASLDTLDSDAQLLEELGVRSYQLWDLSADDWETVHGFRPSMLSCAVDSVSSDELGMVLPGEHSADSLAAQQTLVEYGFLSGTPTRQFGDAAVSATLRAQTYLGRIPTGCFDQGLAAALAAGRSVEESVLPVLSPLGGVAEAGFSRCWFASGVSASRSPDSLRSVVNADNVFLVMDGWLRNLSQQELQLFMHLDAQLVCNGQYAYEAELACEGSRGQSLDSQLLPMALARLIVYAEVPAALASDAQAQWSLLLSAGGDTLTFELQ